jgi:hypothetical protein
MIACGLPRAGPRGATARSRIGRASAAASRAPTRETALPKPAALEPYFDGGRLDGGTILFSRMYVTMLP